METSIWVNRLPLIFPARKTNLNKQCKCLSPQIFSHSNINIRSRQSSSKTPKRSPPPLIFSNNPSDINIEEIIALLRATHQNCDQFPQILHDGSVTPVNPKKLRVALHNSTVVVSAYTITENPYQRAENFLYGRRPRRCLVGFGRTYSDSSLTASIHDLAVAPSLQRLGIGRRILERIIRILYSKGIDDIAAVCSEEQRPFFQTCGFADDVLNSTTMFYSRSATTSCKDIHIKHFG